MMILARVREDLRVALTREPTLQEIADGVCVRARARVCACACVRVCACAYVGLHVRTLLLLNPPQPSHTLPYP